MVLDLDYRSTGRVKTFFGAIELMISDFRTYLDQAEANKLFFRANHAFDDSPELMNSSLDLTRGFIDALEKPGGYTALY